MENPGTYLKSFYQQCTRVWQLLKKPDKKEFITIAKVSAIGLVLVGAIGFVVSFILKIAKIS
jgi:protein transport protein SEC61 subunit gamma and related proteins